VVVQLDRATGALEVCSQRLTSHLVKGAGGPALSKDFAKKASVAALMSSSVASLVWKRTLELTNDQDRRTAAGKNTVHELFPSTRVRYTALADRPCEHQHARWVDCWTNHLESNSVYGVTASSFSHVETTGRACA
jgi:hypothetical protein